MSTRAGSRTEDEVASSGPSGDGPSGGRHDMTHHTHRESRLSFQKLWGKICERMKMEKGSSCANKKPEKKRSEKMKPM